MPRRAQIALRAAVCGVVLMVAVWLLAHEVAAVRQADANILGGFLQLHRPRLDRLTSFIANLCDPMPFIVFAGVPVVVALLRGRPRVAVALAIILLGANETTEVLKPLLSGSRDPVPGVYLTDATWPSGHATAAMSLALSTVICCPARLRPYVGAIMAAFAVAVSYSFLELGWHYPSDVLGGYLVASIWTLIGLAGLWTYEARRPHQVTAGARRRPAFSVGEALAPPIAMLVAAVLLGLVITLARPHTVLPYARHHLAFVVGAAAIATVAFALASGLNLVLRSGWGAAPRAELSPEPDGLRAISGSGPAPTAVRRRR